MPHLRRPSAGPLPRRRAAADLIRRLEPRRVAVRALIGLLALVAVSVALDWRATIADLGARVPVVVMLRDVPAGNDITEADVEVAEWPRALVPNGAVLQIEPDAVARTDLVAGEVLVGRRLLPGPDGLRTDQRLVTLPVPTAPPPVVPGSTVDLYGIRSLGDGIATPATRLTTGTVIDAGDERISVAVAEASVPIVLEHVALGVVDVVIRP